MGAVKHLLIELTEAIEARQRESGEPEPAVDPALRLEIFPEEHAEYDLTAVEYAGLVAGELLLGDHVDSADTAVAAVSARRVWVAERQSEGFSTVEAAEMLARDFI